MAYHSFSIYHLMTALLFQIILQRIFSIIIQKLAAPGVIQNAFVLLSWIVAGYVSLISANLALDHGFRFAEWNMATLETRYDLQNFWGLVQQVRRMV